MEHSSSSKSEGLKTFEAIQKKHGLKLFHEKALVSPGICFRFKNRACFDAGKCGREHICTGCGKTALKQQPEPSPLFLNRWWKTPVSQQVNLSYCGYKVLLVSSCRKHEDEFLSSWEALQSLLQSPTRLQITHYVFSDSPDDLVTFQDLLDRLKM